MRTLFYRLLFATLIPTSFFAQNHAPFSEDEDCGIVIGGAITTVSEDEDEL